MSDHRDEVDFGQAEELVQFGAEKSRLITLVAIFIACSVFVIIQALWSSYQFWADDSIPLVVCPKSFDLDAPVVMNTINDTGNQYVQDRWIRGFVRRYVLNSYPRTEEDAERFFTYVRDHSAGYVRDKYQAFLNEISGIKDKIGSNNTIRFYAKNSAEMRIRRNGDTLNQWTVEVDGYMVKNVGGSEERTVRTLRYVVESVPATRHNPDGLVVIDSNLDLIVDFVSGKSEGQK